MKARRVQSPHEGLIPPNTLRYSELHGLLREWHDDLDRAVFAAYGWEDLAAALVGRPGATTPLLDKPAEQSEAELVVIVGLPKRRQPNLRRLVLRCPMMS